ncbi:MAG: single-stranded DNA-binding protein [Oscillibacter sp.]|nr:single-stranded DNA-binding protein [Oscillibacter sp.]
MTYQNQAVLEGQAVDAPELSHENHGVRFYRFLLRIPRLSGELDILPVVIPEALLPEVRTDCLLRAEGSLRSFNNRSGVGSRLILSVLARVLTPGTEGPHNSIVLSGTLCKPPILRRTPLGRSICDLCLAVPRRYGRADYLPVIAWGQTAAETGRLSAGDPLELEGRIQSRIYHKAAADGVQERTAYEVSIMRRL